MGEKHSEFDMVEEEFDEEDFDEDSESKDSEQEPYSSEEESAYINTGCTLKLKLFLKPPRAA